ncbi:TIM-barrel domain-containing protein [Pedobacter sp. BS3]|uniref:TIM-barrel domain-containing protein n=1 Tax=Pedobacter sp. BS3 TaxID=2567937 RepID=UPI0016594C7E|nr:TIM-barrel domain-containing protein [Pedobacter sp. BS3]
MSASSDHTHKKAGVYKYMSDAFCLGLADLPAGDLRLEARLGYASPVIDIRSDLWGQARGAGPHKLGATFYWAIGDDYRDAIGNYYAGLKDGGIIRVKQNSPEKNAVIALPEFNTWGAQVAIKKTMDSFDEESLNNIYDDLKRSRMKASVFVVDAKWQAEYGPLQHDKKRFPHFTQFLDRVRADGNKVGLWGALFRCYDPADMGLTLKNMLHDPDGKPITKQEGKKSFYFMDLSQPIVQEAFRKQIKQFMHDYHPDIVKYDFGYELPPMSMSIPENKDWAGEKMLKKFIEVTVDALRRENPNVVVMYYALSPFFLDEFDIHSTDDLFMNEEEYAVEANRRLYFSSLMGTLGIPSYGSGGYSWIHMDDIWFDTIVSGALGSLGSFRGDNTDSKASDELMAKFNGRAALRRTSNVFDVKPLQTTQIGANGGRASSWIRFEHDVPVLMALRTQHIMTGDPIPAACQDQVKSTAKVVIASADEQEIAKTTKLNVVPFADGTLTIHHNGKEKTATVITHTFNNPATVAVKYDLKQGVLNLPLTERLKNGMLVERMEVVFK